MVFAGQCGTSTLCIHMLTCLQVTALRASNNNRSAMVLDLFKTASTEYGLPSWVRGDRGGENVDVATHMTITRGPQRASFIWGS